MAFTPRPIQIRGARTHNLRDVSLDIPAQRLVVFTGLSGSGKSSLAFDTLYAEGQRRYVESLSTYARQFLQLMDKPDVDRIDGLSPAIAIEQKSTSHNPRSTVGTVTEIHDHLRLLFARVGTPHCPNHPDQPLVAHSVSQMADALIAKLDGRRVLLLAPLGTGPVEPLPGLFASLQAQGFVRVRLADPATPDVAPVVHRIEELAVLRAQPQTIDVVVDRLRVDAQARQRLVESFETALRLGDGRAVVVDSERAPAGLHPPRAAGTPDGREARGTGAGPVLRFSTHYACPLCDTTVPPLQPRLFSFNSPAGACPSCNGLGTETYFDAQRIVPFPERSLTDGAIAGWDLRHAHPWRQIQALAAYGGFSLDEPFGSLPQAARDLVLHGSGDTPVPALHVDGRGRPQTSLQPFEGVIPSLQRRLDETDSAQVRDELTRLQSVRSCPRCGGERLRIEARLVRVGGRTIGELSRLTLDQAQAWFDALRLDGARALVGERIVTEIAARLDFLNDVGLSYLSLARAADTLSGGEAQRIRLASQIGSGLSGVLYVLDEPSIGLHPRDNDRLLRTLVRLRDLGNSVLVVEHDEDAIRAADHLVDLGPGAGSQGGHVVAQGTVEDLVAAPGSLTGAYLGGRLMVPVPRQRHAPGARWLTVHGARGHNLQDVDAAFPVGLLVAVTGVSGSGKSTLVNDTLLAAAARQIHRAGTEPQPHARIDGLDLFDKVVSVDQSPIGRTPRSNPATYTGLFTTIRELFAEVPLARERGYGPGRFSFNVRGGRCEACEGDGLVRVEMHFLPDVYVPCEVCGGTRYNRETLQVTYKGRHIAEVLELTVDQAAEFFAAVPALARRLQTLRDVGLGYVQLGQSATTLSGGEAQRVRLALELARRDTGHTLYVLDEPTTGLHFHDVAMLLRVLIALRDGGNTVIVIEHNLDVIRAADWIIDLGPEGGSGGGRIVAAGTPEQIAADPASHTGRALAVALQRAAAATGGDALSAARPRRPRAKPKAAGP